MTLEFGRMNIGNGFWQITANTADNWRSAKRKFNLKHKT